MEQNFKCTGNCLNCMPAQRQYCSSQHSYSNMKVLDAMMEIVMEMKGSVEEMKVKIEAIQNNEANVFDPMVTETKSGLSEDTAQEGDGAIE